MRSNLPSGTVTLLFTDVEGSTRLLQELGPDAYAAALQDHRRVLRECFARHGGVEVDTQGDASFVAFGRAEDALAAAQEAQAELEPGPISVRMGLHTGTPHVTDEGYVGEDVHLGARIAAAGHGGQVLVSGVTMRLVDRDLSDLGEHRLKDIAGPVSIFQLGTASFSPLKTISNTNLPSPASSFVGRQAEVADVVALVRGGGRLVTLTGPGGTGKTRLAIEAAAELIPEFKAGVFWIGLASIREVELVEETIAQTLGAKDELAAHVGERELLLLLDNFEQVVEAAAGLSPLLRTCPNLAVLVTSRELLRIDGEVEYPVPPLPDDEAAELFSARSRLRADETVSELCRRLDDLPLAVELAAARANVLSPAQILERLGQRLDLLKGGRDADPRQATLRATIEWSHELLPDDEQRLFARLAVFAGGCTLEAAEQVAGADVDTLQSLVDKSLVRLTGERFWMLETIREYAGERLDGSGEADRLGRKLAEHMLEFGESCNLSAESEGLERPELVLPDQDNFRRAIDWAAGHDLDLAYRLAISLEQFWVMNDPFEGVRRLAALLERGASVSPLLRARARRVYGEATYLAGDFEGAASLMRQALAEFEQLGDERAVAVVLHRMGAGSLRTDLPSARRLLERSLALCRANPNPKLEADIVHKLGWVERLEGDRKRALELFERAAVLCGQVGYTWMQASAIMDCADVSHELGRTAVANEWAREALRLSQQVGDRQMTMYSLALLARFAAVEGRAGRAGLLWGAVEAEEGRGPVGAWDQLREQYAAPVLAQAGPEFEAARARGRGLALDEAVGTALSID